MTKLTDYNNTTVKKQDIILGANNLSDNMCVTMNLFTPPTRYVCYTTLQFSGKVFIGFNFLPNTMINMCFAPMNCGEPKNFYQDFEEYISNNQLYSVLGFSFENHNWRFGDLSGFPWFKENGLTEYYGGYSNCTIPETEHREGGNVNKLFYFEFCDFGTNVVELSSGSQQINLNEGTNPSFTGFRPLYLNTNPEATNTNNAVWEMAFVWVNNSYYFPPEFYLNVNPFTNTVELSNLNIIPNVTSCELMSENEILDVNTGNLCMYRTVKVTNPVLFAKIPNR